MERFKHRRDDGSGVKSLTTDPCPKLAGGKFCRVMVQEKIANYLYWLSITQFINFGPSFANIFGNIVNHARMQMIDANTIANLQMIMNSGDGRHSVVATLLQFESNTPSTWADSLYPVTQDRDTQPPSDVAFNWPANAGAVTGSLPIRIDIGANQIYAGRMAEDLVDILDKLSVDAKFPLQTFAEELAFDFNNLFMVILGHLSIVMATKDTSLLTHERLRKCEELILNMAALLRLLVDVFQEVGRHHRNLNQIDPSKPKCDQTIIPAPGFHETGWPRPNPDLLVQLVMGIITNCVSAHLSAVFQRINELIRETLGSTQLRMVELKHYRNVMRNLKKGSQMARERLVWSHKINQKFRGGMASSICPISANQAFKFDWEHLKSG